MCCAKAQGICDYFEVRANLGNVSSLASQSMPAVDILRIFEKLWSIELVNAIDRALRKNERECCTAARTTCACERPTNWQAMNERCCTSFVLRSVDQSAGFVEEREGRPSPKDNADKLIMKTTSSRLPGLGAKQPGA